MTMKKLVLTSFMLILTIAIAQAQSRDVRKLESFDEVRAGGSFDVYIEQGNSEKVEIEADEGPIDKIITEVKGSTLHIYMEDNWWKNYRFRGVKIYVTAKELHGVNGSSSGNVRVQMPINGHDVYVGSSGSGNLICDNQIESNGDIKISDSGSGNCNIRSSVMARGQVKISNSGSGNISIDRIAAEDVDVNNSGSGGLDIDDGEVDSQHVVMSGSGDVKMGDVRSEDCRISKSGSGSIYVYVKNELSGNSSGSGNVYIKGNTARMNFNSSGSGKIKSMN